MAYDKVVDSTQLDADLTSVANAIRTKGGTSAQLAFPSGFVSAIGDIPSGGGGLTLDEVGGLTYQSGVWRSSGISGDIDISVAVTRMWAFTETSITSAVVRCSSSYAGYSLRERTFSACPLLQDVLFFPPSGAGNHGIGNYAFQNCPSLRRVRIVGTATPITANAFQSCANLTDIYVSWSSGDVANAPWGATNATVHYDTVFDSNGNIVE